MNILLEPFGFSGGDIGVIVAAALTALATVLAAFIAYRRSRRTPHPHAQEPIVTTSPLTTFSGTQNEFTELVMRDNTDLRSQLVSVAHRLDAIESVQQEERQAANQYREAMRRYLAKIFAAWRGTDPMPLPDAEDLELLAQTLPRIPGATRKRS